MEEITYRPIGIIRSPFKEPKGTPIQPGAAEGTEGKVELFSDFVEGLEDLEEFSHVILIYHFHMSRKFELRSRPYMDDKEHGVFAMRGPSRPNPIGISVVRLLEVKGSRLFVLDLDIVDGTPLLDIKPYVPQFDVRKVERIGWLEKKVSRLPSQRDDGRFMK